MNDPTVPAVQAMILLAITMALIGLLAGCATRYQPPGGGLYVAVKHMEEQRGKP